MRRTSASACPFAALKLDRDLIQEIDRPTAKAPIISALVALATDLRMMVIETQMPRDCLWRVGCDAAQGLRLGRPQPAAATWSRLCAELTESTVGRDVSERSMPEGGIPAPVPFDDRERLAALRSLDVVGYRARDRVR